MPPPSPSHPSALHPVPGVSRLEFGRPALHPLEFSLVAVTIIHLGFLPWALGTMHAWSQLTSLGFSLMGFILAALPRPTTHRIRNEASTARRPLSQLIRSPIFWAGLALIAYVLIQALNPAWRFFAEGERWWLEPTSSISWLPSSVEAPFNRSDSWRTLTVAGSLVLLISSIWIGFTRRRSYHALFFALAANAGVLALVGFAQRLSGTDRIFGSYVPSNYAFVASFIYPNHGGCYFNLMIALSLGLAWWHYLRYRKTKESAAPTVIAIWLAVLCGGVVTISYSRMSIMLLIAFIAIACAIAFLRLTLQRGSFADRPEAGPLAILLFTLIGISGAALGSETIRERFLKITVDPVMAVQDRALARAAAGDMFRDHWLKGWGAGCFRYGFSKYTEKYPAIHYHGNGSQRFWEHAHNDILETLCEFGVLGALPIVFILGWITRALWRQRQTLGIVSIVLITTCILVLIHSWVDFVFQNPAVLFTWTTLLLGAKRWAELDRPHARQDRAGFPGRETEYIPEPDASLPA